MLHFSSILWQLGSTVRDRIRSHSVTEVMRPHSVSGRGTGGCVYLGASTAENLMINCLWELGCQEGAKEMAVFLTQLGGGGSR